MAKSISSIMAQIERLQKQAAAIQSEVVKRIQSDIAKYGLTAEQLFGGTPARKSTQTPKAPKAKAKGGAARAPKYADGAGNIWGGIGKRPEWLRQALDAGKALEEFLVAKAAVPATKTRVARKKTRAAAAPAQPKPAAKKRTVTKKAVFRKPRAKKAATAV